MKRTSYAITVPLINQIGEVAFQMWDALDKQFHICYSKNRSQVPHLTLTAGESLTERKVMLGRLKAFMAMQEPFTMKSNGLGIFLLENPLIYIRWYLSDELSQLYTSASNYFKENISVVDSSVDPKIWVPKTTIAMKDVTCEDLPKIIGKLRSYNVKQEMHFHQLALMTYGSNGEDVIETVSLHSE